MARTPLQHGSDLTTNCDASVDRGASQSGAATHVSNDPIIDTRESAAPPLSRDVATYAIEARAKTERPRLLAAAAAYQATLPGVRAHDVAGQFELVSAEVSVSTTPIAVDPRLVAAAELVELGQLELPGVPGVLPTRTPWVRGMRPHVPWRQLQLRLDGIDRHRGRAWTQRDHETMQLVAAQCWNAADIGQRRIAPPQWMHADAIVCPISGELVDLGRNPRVRQLLAIVWAAYEEGAGGVYMSKVDWAAELHCCERSVYNYLRELAGRGSIEIHQTWAPVPGKTGSQRGYLLVRLGPTIVRTAGVAPFERRRPPAGITMELAGELGRTLRERARLRQYHVSGALYRQRTRWSAVSLNRQAFPNSPSPSGTTTVRPPEGGSHAQEAAPCSGPTARAGAPSNAGVDATAEPRNAATIELRGSGGIGSRVPPLRRDAIEVPPSERFGALLFSRLVGEDGAS